MAIMDMADIDALPDHLPEWIRDHLRQYVASGGEQGHEWRGVQTLLLKTIGRRSGKPLVLPLIYGADGDDYAIVASKGGASAHPAWYLNLSSHPAVEVQVATDHFEAVARTADASERERLWPVMAAIWPQYDEYQQATEREIPIVILRRKP